MKSYRRELIHAVVLIGLAAAGCGGTSGGTRGGTGGNGGEVTATLDVGTRYQVMQGFGAASAYYTNWLTDHPHRAAIYPIVFADLGLQILRVGNWYQNSSGTAFADSVAVALAARASLGTGPLILMSSWSPPASLKSNGDTKNGGTLASLPGGGYRYADFGTWWAASLAAYADAGVQVDFLSLQNEPDFTPDPLHTYESCRFDPIETSLRAGYDKALDAVFAATAAMPVVPQILGPEIAGISGSKLQSYMAPFNADPLAGELAGVAHHLYSGGTAATPSSFIGSMTAAAATAAGANKPVFMTEFSAGPDMFNTAWLIHNAVTVEGVAAYIYWGLTWAPGGTGLVTTENPFIPPSQWTTPAGYTVNDIYYAVRHFSKWIATGWQRVSVTTTSSVVAGSAFASPDGQQVTLVLLNTDALPHAVTLDAGTFEFASSAIYRTSGTDERTAAVGAVADGAITMPARSLVTVTLGP